MSLSNNIKKPIFWKKVLIIAIVFFFFITLFSIFVNTGSAVFSGNWQKVYDYHFADKRWIRYVLMRGTISIIYGIYTANRKMK